MVEAQAARFFFYSWLGTRTSFLGLRFCLSELHPIEPRGETACASSARSYECILLALVTTQVGLDADASGLEPR